MKKSKCKICKNEYYARPSHVLRGWGIYCSRKCHFRSERKGKEIPCLICGTLIYCSLKRIHGSKSNNFFCGKSCQAKWRNSVFSGEKHKLWKNGRWTYRDAMLKSGIAKTCTLCKIIDERILAVHHIDENKLNYNISNLAWLCHNCHRLVHCDKLEKQRFLTEHLNIR